MTARSPGRPAGWAEATLGDLCVDKVELAPPGTAAVPYIDIGSIDRETKTVGVVGMVTQADAPTRARQWVRTGDILVSMTRPNLNAVALVPPALNGAVASTGFDVLRPVRVVPGWVFSRVRSSGFVTDMCKGLQGVVYPAIRPSDVRRHVVPLPPLAEQHRIVAALDQHLTRLDAGMQALRRVQAKLKTYRASVLKAACEGRLVPTEAELARREGRGYETAAQMLGRLGLAADSAATGERGVLAEGWTTATIEDLVGRDGEFVDGDWVESKDQDPDGDVRLIQLADVGDGVYLDRSHRFLTSEKARELRCTFLRPGDLLIARMPSPLGRACVFPGDKKPCVTVVDVCVVRGGSSGVDHRWLMRAVNAPRFRAAVESLQAGSTRKRISRRNLASLQLPVPPWREQSRIAAEVERRLSVVEKLETVVETGLERAEKLRQAILKRAFEGKLVPQDPNDEPASVLLERIRAERAAAGQQRDGDGPRRRRGGQRGGTTRRTRSEARG